MIVTTEGIVLRSMKYRDTSRIITVYTKEFGRISGIVKGARSSKHQSAAALQPMSHVSLVVYKKDGRELHTVTQCDLVRPFRALAEELPKMAAGMAIIELVANIAHEEEDDHGLFTLLLEALNGANEASGDPAVHLFRFQVRLAGILGFKPVFDQCVSCAKPVPDSEEAISFELDRGGPLCSKCRKVHGRTVTLTGKQLHYLASLDDGKGPGTARELDAPSRNEIERFLEGFLRKHITWIGPSRTDRVFAKILNQS